MKPLPQMETRLTGIPVGGGIAVARVCKFNDSRHHAMPNYNLEQDKVTAELARVRDAIATASATLDALRIDVSRRLGPVGSEIFATQSLILEDETLFSSVEQLIHEQAINAERAVDQALTVWEKRMQDVDDDYMRERASDFGEIKRRLLDALGNTQPSLQCIEGECLKGNNRIIVAEELTPSLTVELDAEHIMGFVTERGGVNSHAAILARTLGIPAVTGLEAVTRMINCGAEIMVNGITGEVVLWPSEETVRLTKASQQKSIRMPMPKGPVPGVTVQANISVADDVREALHMQAEGIGLYRTEIEMIAAGRLLNEDELYDKYLFVRQSIKAGSVAYRLLDVGSDKPLPFMPRINEENPALGLRGVRFLLAHQDLLRTQARALARVSTYGPVDLLYPMVTDLAQFLETKRVFDATTEDLERGVIRHGIMFEVPAACLHATELLAAADFGSIGTNDLFQYMFAVDRNNALVAGDFDQSKPAFWTMLQMVAQAGGITGKPVSVCGEIGGDPRFVTRLLELGIHSFSMNCQRIPLIRAVVEKFLNNPETKLQS